MAHTSGHWICVDREVNGTFRVETMNQETIVAEVFELADVRLIAIAPELFEILQSVSKAMTFSDPVKIDWKRMVSDIELLIAKAGDAK